MIDIDKKYQTRDGRPVRLISNNGTARFPIVGVIGENSSVECWTSSGKVFDTTGQSPEDLVPVAVEYTRYLNVYFGVPPKPGRMYSSRAEADREASPRRAACLKIAFKEGQFDE